MSFWPRTPPPPPLWLTLYHLVTRLPDTLRAVRDHFLARCPTELTIALLEKELLAAEASIVAPLLLLSTSLVLRRSGLHLLRSGATAARAKGAREAEVTAGEAVVGLVAAVGVVVGLGGLVAAVGVVAAAAGEVAGAGAVVGAAVDAAAAGEGVVEEVAAVVVVVEALAVARACSTLRRPRSSVSGTLSTREGGGGGGGGGLSCTYVIRTGDRTGQTCGRAHPTQRCFSRLDDAWRTQFPEATELPRWADLMKKNIDIFALDFDAILNAMYVMFISGEGAQYLRVPPDPGIRTSEAATLGARVSATPGAGEAAALGASASAPPGS
ncbi:unnamed protein product [Closterium sp. NIES-64]|nr:unnamed protein product [Closterium sp. NIES-64]